MTLRRMSPPLLAFLLAACGAFSEDEVARVISPGGAVEAVLVETNGGATTPFGYYVALAAPGAGWRESRTVATLYGAGRNEQAAGANLRWLSPHSLAVEYLRAREAVLVAREVEIAGTVYRIQLREGVTDTNAPPGGMLHNLNISRRDAR